MVWWARFSKIIPKSVQNIITMHFSAEKW